MSKSLQQRNTRHLLLWLPLVLLVSSILFYILMSMQAHHMQEKQLALKQHNVWNTFIIQQGNIIPHIIGEYDISERNLVSEERLNEPRDTVLYYPDRKQLLPFKIMTTNFIWKTKPFQVTTYVSSTEISHLIIKVFIAEAVIFILLLIAIIIINRKTSGLLWRPFYTTMETVSEYDITKQNGIKIPAETGTKEFNELNKQLAELIKKANQAYINQKQFVENASHEMQTPLSIIRSKLELLINQPGISEKTAIFLEEITEANDRLSQMNKNLLLLAKIDNNQFPKKEKMNVSELVKSILENQRDQYDQNFSGVKVNIQADIFITANRSLMEILFNNLIKNAFIHNIPNGYIHLSLSKEEFVIENSGPSLSVEPLQLLERFKKGSDESKTTGLGLSLVNQICKLYGFKLLYEYKDKSHTLKVIFK